MSVNLSSNAPSDFKGIENNFVGGFWRDYPFFYTNYGNLQLDIVGFLAVLGEGSVLANAQVSTLSKLIFLPRLLPAPQALLRPSRPSKLPTEPGTVSGVFSGNKRDYVNYIGHLVLDAEGMDAYSVRCVQIERDPKKATKTVGATTFGPQSLLAVIGCIESLVLLAFAVAYRDGMAIFAVFLLSSLSTLVGIGNKWELRLHKRPQDEPKAASVGGASKASGGDAVTLPKGDVVIRYPRGNFLIVECNEDVARELYFAPEAIDYLVRNSHVYRLISLVGTMMIMFGVITLANAQIQLQIAFAASYIFLNAAYWVVAALPTKLHWDTTCYKISEQRFSYADPRDEALLTEKKTFTKALWQAIVATKRIGWIKHGEAAPNSIAWEAWLRRAELEAKMADSYVDDYGVKVWKIPKWDAQGYLNKMLADPDYREVASNMTVPTLVEEDALAGSEKC